MSAYLEPHTCESNDLNLLEEIVRINSQTKNITGVNHVQDIIAEQLLQLGFDVVFHENKFHDTGKLLVATLPGQIDRSITFIGHADTVLKPSKDFEFEIGERSVSVSPMKMNVFYIGVDNPVSVTARVSQMIRAD